MTLVALAAGACFVMAAALYHGEQPLLAGLSALIGLAVLWPVLVQYPRISI